MNKYGVKDSSFRRDSAKPGPHFQRPQGLQEPYYLRGHRCRCFPCAVSYRAHSVFSKGLGDGILGQLRKRVPAYCHSVLDDVEGPALPSTQRGGAPPPTCWGTSPLPPLLHVHCPQVSLWLDRRMAPRGPGPGRLRGIRSSVSSRPSQRAFTFRDDNSNLSPTNVCALDWGSCAL